MVSRDAMTALVHEARKQALLLNESDSHDRLIQLLQLTRDHWQTMRLVPKIPLLVRS